MENNIDQQFVEYVVKTLVNKPDAVTVNRSVDEKGVLLELTVDPEDLGRVIGKRGATAQSLRTLLRALGTKNEARYNLKIVDNGEAPARSSQPADTSADDTAVASTDDATESADEEVEEERTSTSDSVSRTRKELEELDDLDI